jgi:formamidopyrimidine-DNA glycosylase
LTTPHPGRVSIGVAKDVGDAHDHVVFQMSSGATITFNDPRRFGVMDLVPSAALDQHAALGAMGPEPLSRDFEPQALARVCAGRRAPIKVALLDQRVVAGLGNIYVSEALPSRASIAAATGVEDGKALRHAARKRGSPGACDQDDAGARHRTPQNPRYRSARFRVYDREGQPCVTTGCDGAIKRITQAGRSTFYCPVCQTG